MKLYETKCLIYEPYPILDRNSFAKLVLDEVQLEGKNPVTWKQFLEGYQNFKLPY